MERTATDTRSLVHQTADELLFEGTRPTVANVRERTGRGSASTINSALRDWWLDLGDRLVRSESRPDIPEPLTGLFNQLWDAAVEQARNSLDSHRQEADKKVAEATEKLETALLSQSQAQKRADGLETRVDELTTLRLTLERQLATETSQRKSTENRIIEIRDEADRAIRDNQELRLQSEKQLEEMKRFAADTEKRFMQEIDNHRESVKRLEVHLKKEAQAWRGQETSLRDQLADVQVKSTTASTENRLLKKQLELVETELKSSRSEKEVLVTQNASKEERFSQLNDRCKQFETKNGELETKRQELESTNMSLREELRVVEDRFSEQVE